MRNLPLLLLVLAWPAHAVPLSDAPTPVLPTAALEMQAQVQARVEEGRVTFQEDLRWTLPAARGLVRLDGVGVPLLLPVVGVPPIIDDHAAEATLQSLEIGAQPGGLQAAHDADGWHLVGTVEAGKPQLLRVRYATSVRDDTLRLGFGGQAAGRTWLSLAWAAGPPVRLTLASERPARLSRFEEGRERLVGANLLQPLGPTDTATFAVSDLPASARRPARTLAWFAGAVVLLGLAVLAGRLRARPSERGPAAPPELRA